MLRQRSISEDSIFLTQTTKVAHIITYLSSHMCLSTWAGAVVSTNVSIQKRKVSLVMITAPGNKISKVSTE